MKKINLFILIIIFILNFTACGKPDVEPTPTSGVVIEEVYTSVAGTLAAVQASAVTPTPLPSDTPMPTNTSLPTQTPVTATQIVVKVSVVATNSGCYNSAFVSDVTIPDGTKMYPGQSFTKTWKISNSGTCAWKNDFNFVHVSGDSMQASTVKLNNTVAVGETVSISVNMVAPSTEGTYYSYWAVADSTGKAVGPNVYVMIVVTKDASTSTPTPTITTTAKTATKTTAAATAAPTTAVPATNTTAPESTDTTEPVSTTESPSAATEDPGSGG